MKSFFDLSSYTNQSRLSNRGKIVKQTSNNKSYFSSYRTIENNSKGKDRKIEKKFNYSNFTNTYNNLNKSKNKSNDSKKIKSKENLILDVRKKNKNFDKEKYIAQSYRQLRKTSFNFINVKIYEKVIDKLFSFMKSILPFETYNEIKMKFISEITKEIRFSNKPDNNDIHNESHSSSITNLIKSIETNNLNKQINSNLKLSYNIINNNINIKKKNINKKHSSLYTLTKSKILNNRTISNSRSKSKSNSKSKSKSKTPSKSKSNSRDKISIIKSNKIILNSRLFEKINHELLKLENSKPFIHKNIIGERKKIINKSNSKPKIRTEINNSLNQNIKINNSKTTTNSLNINNKKNINKNKNIIYNHRINNNKKEIRKNNDNNFLNITNIKLNITEENENEILENETKENVNKEEKKEVITNLENTNEIKNSEQLKKIKSTLEDNLKFMFNFSYEGFLNKESETDSKKSLEDNINNNSKIYKKKYNY